MDGFHPLPKPKVIYHGTAGVAEQRGQPLLELVELKASNSQYAFVASVTNVDSLPDGGHDVECDVDPYDGRVHIITRTTPASLLPDPSTIHNLRRIQLHPNGTCGITFFLPGPVDPTTVEIFNRSTTTVEARLRIA